jgi:hypothetical protein
MSVRLLLHVFSAYAFHSQRYRSACWRYPSLAHASSAHHANLPHLLQVGRLGIGICYDIRFPELALLYAARGCQLIVYPGKSRAGEGSTPLCDRNRGVDAALPSWALWPEPWWAGSWWTRGVAVSAVSPAP